MNLMCHSTGRHQRSISPTYHHIDSPADVPNRCAEARQEYANAQFAFPFGVADVVPNTCSSPPSWRRSLPPVTSNSKDLLSVGEYLGTIAKVGLSLVARARVAHRTPIQKADQRLNSNLFPAKSLAKNRCGYSTPFAPIRCVIASMSAPRLLPSSNSPPPRRATTLPPAPASFRAFPCRLSCSSPPLQRAVRGAAGPYSSKNTEQTP